MKASKMKIANSIFKTFVLSVLMIAQVHFAYAQNAAILPPAKTTFVDQNGKPLTSGKVDFYIPGTTTRKTTWQDAAATIPNANPVVLDAAGRALILGNGSYRQVVKDRNNTVIWDQVTSSAGAGGSGSVTVGDGNAVGTVLPYSGIVAPANYAFSYGQELSRATYVQLMNAITLTQNITCVSGNATLTTIADTTQLNIGAAIEAACVPAGSTILSKTATTVTISANATVSTTTTGTFFPWGAGNGITTFNAPDLRGVVLPGRNNMGGSSSANLSSTYYTDPNAIAGSGGNQSKTLLLSNLPSIASTGTVSVPTGAAGVPIASASFADLSFSPSGSGTHVPSATGWSADTTLDGTASVVAATGGIAVSATVAAGGSGYTAGTQLLTVIGGTCSVQPQFNATIVAGAITDPVLVTAGQCSVIPSNPASTTGGGGTAGTLNVTYSAVPFSIIQPSKTINYIVKILPDVNLSIARCANLIDAGTACTYNVGTSGNTIPLLNTANSFSAAQIFSSGVAISGGATSITDLNTPTNPTDAATKAYVDSVATGLNILAQSRLATAAVLPNTPTYSNGASGVGATLTAGVNSTLTVDGTVAALNDVILVKNQASAFQNGIYTVTTAGSGAAAWVLTRATYFDQAAEMKAGSYTLITAGATNAATSWALQTAVTTVGTDDLNWLQFSATAGVTSVGGFNGIVTAAQVTSSCNIFTGTLSGCVPSGSGTTAISYLNPTTQAWTTPTSITIETRAAAAALDLTGVSVVKTLGYATAGDGGGATFKNVGSAKFIEAGVAAGSITNAGSLYTNGTYRNVTLTGGTGLRAIGLITVSGGVVSSVTVTQPGYKYTVGDVLSASAASLGGTGSGFTWTVSSVRTPTCSFTDAGANNWEFVVDSGNYANLRQCGGKLDWAGADGSATDDTVAFNNLVNWASYACLGFVNVGNGGCLGQQVIIPQGTAYFCTSTLIIPYGVSVTGQGAYSSVLKVCDSGFALGSHFIEICDKTVQVACFGANLMRIGISTKGASSNSNIAAVYSNNIQDDVILDNIHILSGQRAGIWLENGYGGASHVDLYNVEIDGSSTINDMIRINYGTTMVNMKSINIANSTGIGMQILGGFVDIIGFHCEAGLTSGITINIPTLAGGMVRLHNATGNTNCTSIVTLSATNTPGNFVIGTTTPNSSTNVVLNGQPAGTSRTTAVVADMIFNP